MKSKYVSALLIVMPVCCIGLFLYMAYFNAAYDHPGRSVYEARCAACHGDKGEGIQALVPPVYHTDLALANIDSLPCWIQGGINHPITVNGINYDQVMYPIALNEVEMTNLLNYLTTEMIPVKRNYTADSMSIWLKQCN